MLNLDKKLTVGIIITQGHWGGGQRYVYDLATHLAKSATVIVGVGDPNGSCDLQHKIKAFIANHPELPLQLVQLNYLQRDIHWINDMRAIEELKAFATDHNCDIMHYNSSKGTVIGGQVAKSIQAQSFVTIHGWVSQEVLSPMRKSLYTYLEKRAAHQFHKLIFADSHSLRVAQEKFHVPKEKTTHIYHGIDTPQFEPKDEAISTLSTKCKTNLTGKTIIGTIANFYPAKNLELFVQTIAELRKTQDNIVGVIIGEGETYKKIETLRNSLNLKEHVLLSGKINNAAKLLKAFNTFVLTSTKEGYPYVLLEATAANIPIVSSRVGGTPDILPEYALVDEFSAEQFAKLIIDHKSAPTHQKHDAQSMTDNTLKQYQLAIQ